ncbi:hypothetical protein Taro_030110 [Colocasia esculenta]|uniref:Uncharacterized protein n=1 Tax=Colocasia esculenta TaxID=4460 RepID=A0A843VLL6_COLES|nr:hypothetical protein [Colocasia esculenta]
MRSCGTTTRSRSSSPSRLLRPAQTTLLKSTKGFVIFHAPCNLFSSLEQPYVKRRKDRSAIQGTVLALSEPSTDPVNATARYVAFRGLIVTSPFSPSQGDMRSVAIWLPDLTTLSRCSHPCVAFWARPVAFLIWLCRDLRILPETTSSEGVQFSQLEDKLFLFGVNCERDMLKTRSNKCLHRDKPKEKSISIPLRVLAEGHLGVNPRPLRWCQRPDMDANINPGVQRYGRQSLWPACVAELQASETRKPAIGGLSPTALKAVKSPDCSGDLLLQGGCWIDEEGLPDLGMPWSSLRNPESSTSRSFLGQPKESFTEP